jgi:hypothetical protein
MERKEFYFPPAATSKILAAINMKVTRDFIIETSGKALVSIIPYVGGSIGSILSDVLAERKQQRVNELLKQLSADLDSQKDKINNAFIQKNGFLDLFELSAKKVMEERSETKRIIYKNILVNGIIQIDSDLDDLEKFIRMVENTSERNIYLMKVLSSPSAHNISIGNPASILGHNVTNSTRRIFEILLPDWPMEEIVENLIELESLGLIKSLSNNLNDMVGQRGLGPVQESLTTKGKRFIKYIAN